MRNFAFSNCCEAQASNSTFFSSSNFAPLHQWSCDMSSRVKIKTVISEIVTRLFTSQIIHYVLAQCGVLSEKKYKLDHSTVCYDKAWKVCQLDSCVSDSMTPADRRKPWLIICDLLIGSEIEKWYFRDSFKPRKYRYCIYYIISITTALNFWTAQENILMIWKFPYKPNVFFQL